MIRIELAWLEAGAAREEVVTLPRADASLRYRDLFQLPMVAARTEPFQGTFGWSVFGERRSLDDPVRDGDRLEILPGLRADPKQARRQRVQSSREADPKDKWVRPR